MSNNLSYLLNSYNLLEFWSEI